MNEVRILGLVAVLAVVLASGCGGSNGGTPGGDPGPGPVGPDPGSGSIEAVYEGTMDVLVEYYDFCDPTDAPRPIGTQSFSYPATVVVGTPRSDGTSTEDNPFGLSVRGPTDGEGSLDVTSATVATTPETGRPVVLQYWRLSENGSGFEGILTDDHQGLGPVNLMSTAEPLNPCFPAAGGDIVLPDMKKLAEGAVLNGTGDESSVTLQVAGETHDGTRAFRAEVYAERTE